MHFALCGVFAFGGLEKEVGTVYMCFAVDYQVLGHDEGEQYIYIYTN